MSCTGTISAFVHYVTYRRDTYLLEQCFPHYPEILKRYAIISSSLSTDHPRVFTHFLYTEGGPVDLRDLVDYRHAPTSLQNSYITSIEYV